MPTLSTTESVTTRAVYLTVDGADPVEHGFRGQQLRPTVLRLSYVDSGDGRWIFDGGRLSGPGVRKDGTDGQSERAVAVWRADAQEDERRLPAWVTEAVHENWPVA